MPLMITGESHSFQLYSSHTIDRCKTMMYSDIVGLCRFGQQAC